MPVHSMATTLAQKTLEQVASEIVSGALPPGQRLEEQSLAARFRVSRTPVREALRLLSGMGLVDVLPHRGVVVAKIDLERLTDMFDTLGELEGLCASLSARRMTAPERKQLTMIHRRTKEAMSAGNTREWSVLNEQFHGLIYQGTHSPSLQQTVLNFRQRLAPFRLPEFFQHKRRQRVAFAEHEVICRSIAAGDEAQAAEALRSHVASSSASVIDHLTTRTSADTLADSGAERAEGK
jgi:DNA-binding GntR family transcriptional regulator